MEYTFTSDNFEEEILKSDVPVLVDMFATWCGPCKMMAVPTFLVIKDGEVKAKLIGAVSKEELVEAIDQAK